MIKFLVTAFVVALVTARPNSNDAENKAPEEELIEGCCDKTHFTKEDLMETMKNIESKKSSFCQTKESKDWVQCLLETSKKDDNQTNKFTEAEIEKCIEEFRSSGMQNCTMVDCVMRLELQHERAKHEKA